MLPISEFLPKIKDRLAIGRNVVLQAEPGAGKSTQLPMSLLNADWLNGKRIVMLEPRRVAAKSIAYYLAGQLGEDVGQSVGYHIKNERKVSKNTILQIVTEGILTRRLQTDPEISDIGLIIFDEFHERSLHADLSLLISMEVQQTIRDDLRLLIMSATMDTAFIASYISHADIIKCPGRVFPVAVNYTNNNNSKESIDSQVVTIVKNILSNEMEGDTLVFLPGKAEILRCLTSAKEAVADDARFVFLPLYGGLPMSKQEQALIPDADGKRRVIFTTNIAETSLTIDDVTCVIDSGLEKVLIYDPSSCMTRLETRYISMASAEQRKGRAGRTKPGSCFRIWSEQKQRTLREYQGEEILSADLSGFLLELFIWGASDYNEINWLTKPPHSHFMSAKQTLLSLELIDINNKVTELGHQAVGVGLPPRLAAMLLQASGHAEKGIACELAALLADRDIFYHHNGTDIIDRMLALQDYKKNRNTALKTYPINRVSIESIQRSVVSLRKLLHLNRIQEEYSLAQLQQSIGRLLLCAYPDRLAKRRSDNCGRYQLANGRGVLLFNEDPLYGADWLVVAECDAQKKEGRIYRAAFLTFQMVQECLHSQFIEEDHVEFDKKRQKVIGQRIIKYSAITIKSTMLSNISSENFQQCLMTIFQNNRIEDILNWTDRCENWLSRAQWLGEHLEIFPKISKHSLVDTLNEWLFPYLSGINSITKLQKVNIYNLLEGLLSWDDQQLLKKEAPTEYKTPSNKRVPIKYDFDQGPTVSVQLQEMFGEIESPRIATGKIPIRFELLSPARRPIQTTSDLGNFWKTSYFEVIKDMKGKYPKHRWPDKPMLEKAGKSIKRH